MESPSVVIGAALLLANDWCSIGLPLAMQGTTVASSILADQISNEGRFTKVKVKLEAHAMAVRGDGAHLHLGF